MNLGSFQNRTKTIGTVLFLLVVLGVAVYFGRNVPSLLSRASSCPAQNVTALQVSANSAVINWESADATQGRVEYGTSATNLSFSAPETSEGKSHNVPLTLLTPSTAYFYLIRVGNTRCDSTGQKCDEHCAPWSFTTTSVVPQDQTVKALPSITSVMTKTTGVQPTASGDASPTSSLSGFCRQLQANIGKSKQDAATWASVSQYDMDANGILNGKDVISCVKSGK